MARVVHHIQNLLYILFFGLNFCIPHLKSSTLSFWFMDSFWIAFLKGYYYSCWVSLPWHLKLVSLVSVFMQLPYEQHLSMPFITIQVCSCITVWHAFILTFCVLDALTHQLHVTFDWYVVQQEIIKRPAPVKSCRREPHPTTAQTFYLLHHIKSTN